MNHLVHTSKYICLMIVAVIAFSITHAKDVTYAFSMKQISAFDKVSTVKSVDNGIHLDLHTHVSRQTISSLLHAARDDRPQTGSRELKKVVVRQERAVNKLTDGLLGHYIPQLS